MAAPRATVYNNTPAPLPGNVPSIGFEATGTSEFGGQVQFSTLDAYKPKVSVVMSSWGCQTGSWSTGDCGTEPGASFLWPLTLNVYAVNGDNTPGALLKTMTQSFNIPYRPSANFNKCHGANAGKWYQGSSATCYNGKSVVRTFSLGSADLPQNVILAIAFDTTHSGANPVGEGASCYGADGGCPYDALNVGTSGQAPSPGGQPVPDDAYLNSSQGFAYCDGGADGTGTFRLDAGCWTGYQPAFKVKAK